jgi:hypothetical protein
MRKNAERKVLHRPIDLWNDQQKQRICSIDPILNAEIYKIRVNERRIGTALSFA